MLDVCGTGSIPDIQHLFSLTVATGGCRTPRNASPSAGGGLGADSMEARLRADEGVLGTGHVERDLDPAEDVGANKTVSAGSK